VAATRKLCTKHAPSSKTECGHLNGGKSKAVTYAFPPGYRENAEEEEDYRITKQPSIKNKIISIVCLATISSYSVHLATNIHKTNNWTAVLLKMQRRVREIYNHNRQSAKMRTINADNQINK
jgi:hypothetical protein